MDTKIAVDIVILPPEEVMEKIIAINREAVKRNEAWGMLGSDDYFPHISLVMGGVRSDDLDKVNTIVDGIVKDYLPMKIELFELSHSKKSNSEMYFIRANKTEALQKLHESLMDSLKPYFFHDCTKESLYKKPGEEIANPHYINTFFEKNSYIAFDPHITLRTKAEYGRDELPIIFTATAIAICHVGEMTTCRKIISLLTL